jgi:hypothetical protein
MSGIASRSSKGLRHAVIVNELTFGETHHESLMRIDFHTLFLRILIHPKFFDHLYVCQLVWVHLFGDQTPDHWYEDDNNDPAIQRIRVPSALKKSGLGGQKIPFRARHRSSGRRLERSAGVRLRELESGTSHGLLQGLKVERSATQSKPARLAKKESSI